MYTVFRIRLHHWLRNVVVVIFFSFIHHISNHLIKIVSPFIAIHWDLATLIFHSNLIFNLRFTAETATSPTYNYKATWVNIFNHFIMHTRQVAYLWSLPVHTGDEVGYHAQQVGCVGVNTVWTVEQLAQSIYINAVNTANVMRCKLVTQYPGQS